MSVFPDPGPQARSLWLFDGVSVMISLVIFVIRRQETTLIGWDCYKTDTRLNGSYSFLFSLHRGPFWPPCSSPGTSLVSAALWRNMSAPWRGAERRTGWHAICLLPSPHTAELTAGWWAAVLEQSGKRFHLAFLLSALSLVLWNMFDSQIRQVDVSKWSVSGFLPQRLPCFLPLYLLLNKYITNTVSIAWL